MRRLILTCAILSIALFESLALWPSTEVQSAPTPDFNGDGMVGFSDFVLFVEQFGASQGDGKYEAKYDLDVDGAIGFADFLIFARNFGKALNVSTTGICNRTPQVCGAILAALPPVVDDCALVTEAHLSSITSLNLGSHGITALQGDDFSGLSSLRLLDFNHNALSALPEGVFSGLSSLEDLSLSRNGLSTLPEGVFSDLSRLQRLFLNHNALSALPEGVFSGLDSLHSLYLSNNALSALPEGFSSLSSLHSLYLDNNSLSTLSEGFSGLDRLSEISLTGNALSALPEDMFAGLYRLEALWLEDNPGSPFTLTIELERTDNTDNTAPGPATVVVKLAEGAPFDMTVNLSAQGGTLSDTTATISSGHTASEAVVVTQSGVNLVSVNLGAAPELPVDYYRGIQTAVGAPLVLFGQSANPQGN